MSGGVFRCPVEPLDTRWTFHVPSGVSKCPTESSNVRLSLQMSGGVFRYPAEFSFVQRKTTGGTLNVAHTKGGEDHLRQVWR